jgi:hypothetical protein
MSRWSDQKSRWSDQKPWGATAARGLAIIALSPELFTFFQPALND